MKFESDATNIESNVSDPNEELRRYKRNPVNTEVIVNEGIPYQGGILHDISVGGAAIAYPDGAVPENDPVVVGQVLHLLLKGRIKMPGRVVRTFDGGFATQFDFSIAKYS
jgi:hypothetical protein